MTRVSSDFENPRRSYKGCASVIYPQTYSTTMSDSDDEVRALEMQLAEVKKRKEEEKKRQEAEAERKKQEAEAEKERLEAQRKRAAELAAEAKREFEREKTEQEAREREARKQQGTSGGTGKRVRDRDDCRTCVQRGTECQWPGPGSGRQKSCFACAGARTRCVMGDGVDAEEEVKAKKRKVEGKKKAKSTPVAEETEIAGITPEALGALTKVMEKMAGYMGSMTKATWATAHAMESLLELEYAKSGMELAEDSEDEWKSEDMEEVNRELKELGDEETEAKKAEKEKEKEKEMAE